jgi:hypothetical protein
MEGTEKGEEEEEEVEEEGGQKEICSGSSGYFNQAIM